MLPPSSNVVDQLLQQFNILVDYKRGVCARVTRNPLWGKELPAAPIGRPSSPAPSLHFLAAQRAASLAALLFSPRGSACATLPQQTSFEWSYDSQRENWPRRSEVRKCVV